MQEPIPLEKKKKPSFLGINDVGPGSITPYEHESALVRPFLYSHPDKFVAEKKKNI